MAEEIVLNRVRALIQSSPGAENIEIKLDTLISELRLDSLRLLEIVFELERHFCVEIDEAALIEVVSVGDLVHMVTSKLGEANCDH